MKSKPVSHKSLNTFKFQTFSERLAGINIDIIHRVRDVNQTPDEADTFFFETLEKWMELNCTEDFDNLCKELGYEIQTLPQVIHKQNAIVQILNTHIQNPSSLSLNSALELIVALARDLQVDFYPYFNTFFSSLVQLLCTKDTELLENVFMCLSYLFKFLWRYMVKDIENIYNLYLPLLLDQKEYIRSFAAESIAFLMRKVRDKESFFIFVFRSLETHPMGTDGIAQLLFQTMKGREKEFHSCTSSVFSTLLKCLGKGLDQEEELPWETIQNVAKQLILLMAAHTEQQHSTVIWKLMFDSITKLNQQFVSQETKEKANIHQHLSKILSIFEVFIEFYEGKLISLPDDIAKILLNVLQFDDLSANCILHNIQCIASIFFSHYYKINKDTIHDIIKLIYDGHLTQDFIFIFTRKMFSHPQFERDILPSFLEYCKPQMQLTKVSNDSAILSMLAEYVCKKISPLSSGEDINILTLETTLGIFRNCNLDIEIDKWLLMYLKFTSQDEVLERLPSVWSSLICLPHASNVGNKDVILAVQKISQVLCAIATENNIDRNQKEAVSFVLCYALMTLIQLQAGNIIYTVFTTDLLVKLLIMHHDLNNILLLSDVFLTHTTIGKKQSMLSHEKFAEVVSVIQVNLMSPFHKIRLLTLRILTNLSSLKIIDETSLFQICLSAELVPATVSDVRKKIQLLCKLKFEHISQISNYEHYEKIAIQYLIGMLYINFELLWLPVRQLIASHACIIGNEFWDIYIPHLTSLYTLIEEKRNASENLTALFRVDDDVSNLFHQKMNSYQQEIADHIHHRILLWKTMEMFPEEAEPRNRALVTLLFQFMRNEFYVGSSFLDKWQDKSQQKLNINDAESDRNKCKISGRRKKQRREKSNVRKSNNRILVSLKSHLTVFSKFKNPKAFYQQEELHKLYSTLLSFRDAEVQKLAFDCLMRYDPKNVKPYVENFYRLLDNKTFKTEIVLFNLDCENGAILEQHRTDVLPLLMRILYGKMLCKTGNNTSGRNQAQARRDLVLRFLAGCNENEIQVFLDIAFVHFKEIITDDIGIMVKKIKKIEALSSINLNIYNSALNTLGTVFSHLGNLVPGLLPRLLKILLAIATTATSFLEKENTIDTHSNNMLKTMRTTSIKRLTEFFSWYSSYPFSAEEIDAIFHAVIWHLLPRLEKESRHHCSPLLCLFSAWSENPRYFPLFVKYYPADPSLSPLPQIMKLYISSNIKPSVIELITNILLELLYNEQDAEIQNHLKLKVNDCLVISEFESADLEGSPNYGALILLPYIQHILERLKISFQEAAKSYKKPPTIKELKILSRISSYVSNIDRITELVEILLLILSTSKKRNQDTESEILEIILKFIKQVNVPKDFLRSLAPLFASLFYQKSRNLLCSIISAIAEVEESVKEFSVITNKLNAWNPKQLEEPDYMSRLDGYKMATQILNDIENKDVDGLLVIVYNCMFFVKMSEDISLRDSASYFLQKLAFKLVEKKDDNKALFHIISKQVLLKEIKAELKNRSEVVRHEYIKILASLLCNDHFLTSLKELSQLCNEDQEMDFWENIRHIQIHRRIRAMTRFAQNLKSGKYTFHPNTLTSFIMPIAMSFLYDAAYSKHNNLIDAAVDIIGITSYYLPWHRYLTTFQYYLGLLFRKPEFHKVSVKIIVAILDGFHFDLSKSKGLQTNTSMADSQDSEHQTNINNENIDDEKEEDKLPIEKEILNDELSTKIHSIVAKNLLPKLHTCLSETFKQDEHKLASHSDKEDEILVRLPIALAMVKLLQNLPHGMLEQNIPGIYLKLCQLLKSHSESVRQTTRETLVKIMKSLGPKYLWYLLKEMRAMLKRGYQLHVLAYTIHAVLTNLQDQLSVGDLDSCLDAIIQICNEDLFGEVAEEKEVEKIAKKLKEAGATKTYATYQILGKYISDTVLKNLVIPLTEILASTHNHKTVTKVQECLRHIILGLIENEDISIETLLIFIHATVKESIFYCTNKKKESQKVKKYQKSDSYLISKEPPRGVVHIKKSAKTNSHVLVEFGLQLFNSCLKKEKLSSDNQHHLEMLDPLISILNDCLQSSFAKVISSALRCFVWILTFPLPSLQELITDIATNLFVLLNKYAGIGMAQGDNFEIVVMCFKSLTVMLRNVDYYSFTDDQLRVLLSYAEQDIFDHTRQATAFNLLRAILSRRLIIPEIHPIAEKIAEMSITDKEEHTRIQCRQVYMLYLLKYVSKQKYMAKSLSFYVNQLEYEHEYGRASSLEMLNAVFNTFDLKELKQYSGLFFIPLSARLVNDESPQCRNLSALAIKNFLSKIDQEERTSLFSIVVTWLKNRKMAHRRLGAQLCGLFAEVEKDHFEIRLSQILDIFQEELDPAKYEDMKGDPMEKSSDHILYHLLNALSKIISVCPILRSDKFSNEFNGILENIRTHILHPHIWIQLAAGQLFGLLFSLYPIDEIVTSAFENKHQANQYLLYETRTKLKQLSKNFCTQLSNPNLIESLAEQVLKNLIYLSKVFYQLSKLIPDDSEEFNSVLLLNQLIKSVCREANIEVVKNPKVTLKRTCAFKYIAAMALEMDKNMLSTKLSSFLTPLCREVTDKSLNTDPALKILAQEVLDLLSKIIGTEIFTETLSKVQSFLTHRRSKRKQESAAEALTNPQKYARKKIKKQQNKKVALKRKMTKPGRSHKKLKLTHSGTT